MTSEITVRYTDELIRSAAWRFMVRYVRRDFVLATIMVVLAFGFWFALELDWRMPLGLLLLAFGLILVVGISGYRYTQLSVTKFRALNDPTSTWRFSPEFIAVKNEMGSSEFRWDVVTEIWRYPDFWLLHFGRAGYSVLPMDSIPEELQAFIAAQVQAHGGKVA